MRALATFLKDRSGTLSVETVLIFPLLVWAFGATLVFWDAYKTNGALVSATNVVGDLVSREGDKTIDNDYLNGLDLLLAQLVPDAADTDVRISVVELRPGVGKDDPPFHALIGSEGTGRLPDRENIDDLADIIPNMAVSASLILVETQAGWSPFLDGVLGARAMESFAFVSPRFDSTVPISPLVSP